MVSFERKITPLLPTIAFLLIQVNKVFQAKFSEQNSVDYASGHLISNQHRVTDFLDLHCLLLVHYRNHPKQNSCQTKGRVDFHLPLKHMSDSATKTYLRMNRQFSFQNNDISHSFDRLNAEWTLLSSSDVLKLVVVSEDQCVV
uniref:Neur_chan_LBD domain-containing protein n=1 Tax=Heterorhabditis bacteriophora TaxID=37862 RepID=A0A1I7WZZ8_HETBA